MNIIKSVKNDLTSDLINLFISKIAYSSPHVVLLPLALFAQTNANKFHFIIQVQNVRSGKMKNAQTHTQRAFWPQEQRRFVFNKASAG